MAEVWIPLFTGAVLVLIGFLAAQAFDRYRLPDYIVLMGVGVVLGSGVLPLGPWNPEALLLSARPILLGVAIAFILFEGGLALNLRRAGKAWSLAAVHTVVSILLTVVAVWITGVYALGLGTTTALILALAMCAPSGAIVMSFLPRIRVTENTRLALTLEGVLGNIVAAALVLTLVRFPGGVSLDESLVPFFLNALAAFGVAVSVGLAWDRVVGSARPLSFVYMTSVALALFLYAVGEGLLGGNGGLAAFAFGLVLGRWGPSAVRDVATRVGGSQGLQEFHSELVFLLRTFFFVYLGLLIDVTRFTAQAFLGAAVLAVVFGVVRLPTIAVIRRTWRLPTLDTRILRAVVARGLTDTVLVLYAIAVGVIPPADAGAVADLLFLVVIITAIVTSILIARAARTPVPEAKPPLATLAPSTALPPPPPPDEVRGPPPPPGLPPTPVRDLVETADPPE